jgi:Polyketide cyclase / dehydrase and lipid transport
MVQVQVERTIAASPEQVFEWLLDPANLTVSPVHRKGVWAKGSSGPGVGAVREVTGFGFWGHEQITAYDAPGTTPISSPTRSPPRNTRGVRSRALRRATARMSIG